MAYWFWIFLFFSFLGYLLEKLYAKLTRAEKQNRKGFLLLPLCPVYGLGIMAVMLLPRHLVPNLWWLIFWGAAVTTAGEFSVHWLYEKVFGVAFWDYSATKMDVDGRICLPFSLLWGALSALALRVILPAWEGLYAFIPDWLTAALMLLFLLDCVSSAHLLWRYHDTERLDLRRIKPEDFR